MGYSEVVVHLVLKCVLCYGGHGKKNKEAHAP